LSRKAHETYWSDAAQADCEYIYDYIDSNNPRAAIAGDDRLEEAVERLMQFPMSGRIGRMNGTRELVVIGTPYIAAYQLTDRIIRIL